MVVLWETSLVSHSWTWMPLMVASTNALWRTELEMIQLMSLSMVSDIFYFGIIISKQVHAVPVPN